MEWWTTLLVIFGALLGLMAIGLPIAFSFLAVNVVGAWLVWNGPAGLNQLTLSIYESVTSFALLPVPLFALAAVAVERREWPCGVRRNCRIYPRWRSGRRLDCCLHVVPCPFLRRRVSARWLAGATLLLAGGGRLRVRAPE